MYHIVLPSNLSKQFIVAIRWMLGVFEAGLWPGSIFVMSNFYKRNEFGIRIAIFNSAVTFSGAFSGLLAARLFSFHSSCLKVHE